MDERIKELEEKNDRLLLELGYLQGKVTQVEALEVKLVKLEIELQTYRRSESRAWKMMHEARREQEVTRSAASEAIRQLQVEIERLNVSHETPWL
jgi:hypothetical protein